MQLSESNTSKNKSLITIGIPTYNEEKNIASTLDSILNQKYQDIEIIVSDNKSTDNTLEIVQGYIKNNNKIKILQSEKNQGALENWNTLARYAKGKYFVIAGAHDLWSENYLSCLINLLENNENSVLAFGKTIWIDENNNEIGKSSGFIDTSGFSLIQRYSTVFWGNQHALYGVFRLSALRKTHLHIQMFASGAILLNELSLLGDFVTDTNAIWYRRINRKFETREQRLKRYYQILFKKKKRRVFPTLHFLFCFLRIPLNKDIRLVMRFKIRSITFFNFMFRYGKYILSDIKSLLIRPFHSG